MTYLRLRIELVSYLSCHVESHALIYSRLHAHAEIQVALRLKAAGKSVRAMDTIPYVIAEDGTENPAT